MERGLGDIGRDAPAPAPPGSEQGPIDEMNRSLEENPDPTHRYVQLATVRPDGTPACRTVVFRGFMPDAVAGLPSCALQFTTDTLSEKAAELAANSAAEACWWFPTSQEQYRVQGRLRLITDALSEEADEEEAALAKARRVMWAKMSPRARLSWLWPAPKSVRPADATAEQDEADYSPVVSNATQPTVSRPFLARFPPFFRRSFALSGFLAPRRRERAKNGEKWAKFGGETGEKQRWLSGVGHSCDLWWRRRSRGRGRAAGVGCRRG